MTSFSRKRFDRAKNKKRSGRTPDILRKSGPHTPKKESKLLRNKSELYDWSDLSFDNSLEDGE